MFAAGGYDPAVAGLVVQCMRSASEVDRLWRRPGSSRHLCPVPATPRGAEEMVPSVAPL